MSQTVRIGVIGVGTMGFAHAGHLASGKTASACLAALCDTDPARRETLKQAFPGIPVFACAEDLFAARVCDAVVIATPHYAHPEIGIQAFEHGLHVLSEKPVAVQISRARAFAEAAARSGKTFCVMFNQRTEPIFMKARELVQSGALGAPKRIHWIITNWYRTQFYYDSGSWRATWAGEGGGVLMNQAPHQLDLLQWIFGMPRTVRAFCRVGAYHRIEVEDDALIYGEYENGATMVFQTTTGEFPGTNRLEITGDRGKLVLEEGLLKLWTLEQPERTVCSTANVASPKIPVTYQELRPSRAKGAHGIILQNFVDHILHGVPLIAPGADALRELELSNAAYYSAWTDQTVRLPLNEQAFDAALELLKKGSTLREKTESAADGAYHARWQVQW